MRRCEACPLNELWVSTRMEAERIVEAYGDIDLDDDETYCLDVETLVDKTGYDEDEAAAILKCLVARTVIGCAGDEFDAPEMEQFVTFEGVASEGYVQN